MSWKNHSDQKGQFWNHTRREWSENCIPFSYFNGLMHWTLAHHAVFGLQKKTSPQKAWKQRHSCQLDNNGEEHAHPIITKPTRVDAKPPRWRKRIAHQHEEQQKGVKGCLNICLFLFFLSFLVFKKANGLAYCR